nr:hypothetical protein [Tanacetum cinerariifolium]
MELWVELKRLYEPYDEDQLWIHTQNLMHAPVEWKLYDTCGVHHVTAKDKEIFMLVEKDYPLRKGLAIGMISYKLQVKNYLKMENDLILKIYKIASSPRQQGTVVPFSGAKERHEKIERLTTPMVVPFSLAPYIKASVVENGTRNRTDHHSNGGAILASLVFLFFYDLVEYMCTNGTTFSLANGCPTKCGAVRFLVSLSILLT